MIHAGAYFFNVQELPTLYLKIACRANLHLYIILFRNTSKLRLIKRIAEKRRPRWGYFDIMLRRAAQNCAIALLHETLEVIRVFEPFPRRNNAMHLVHEKQNLPKPCVIGLKVRVTDASIFHKLNDGRARDPLLSELGSHHVNKLKWLVALLSWL